jgi:GTPase Era involved in 16S rRNA processing
MHWTVCEHVGLQVTGRDCEHVSERVITVNGTAIMCDVPGITDRKTFSNRTDTILNDKWEKTCLLIDIYIYIAIPDDSNVKTKDTKKMASKKT